MAAPNGRTSEPALDDELAAALVRAGRFFRRGDVSPDLRTLTKVGGREADSFYRDRWSYDKVIRSTHGVNCTGSWSWKVYVKDGIITWEAQQTDYPSAGPDRPEYEPRGCPRGAAFSWYTYSPTRVPMLSFYDWYADLPVASPHVFGDQTDVPESGGCSPRPPATTRACTCCSPRRSSPGSRRP